MSQSLPLPWARPDAEDLGRLDERMRAALSQKWLAWAAFVGVVGLALFLNGWQLSKAGYGNTYYAAAVRSMTLSWKNFFFGALDPGGFITVDKPPVFLWVDALSARVFGYSSWALLLPSALAGAAAVALVWLIVRRYFGVVAATIAGLVLALTPISVAVDRLNLPEPFYILALVGAAAAVIRSLDSRRWWAWTALAGFLVGVAFNTKMLAGWIPGPALALAIVVGVRGPWNVVWKQWLLRLALLAAVTFAVSASWMLIVDAWPASSRPYVGGSTDNTVTNLALGYDGFGRLDGTSGGGGRGGPPRQTTTRQTAPGGQTARPAPNRQANGGQPANRGGFQGPGGIVAGTPSVLRMFDPANGGQIAWFLPFAVLGGLAALWRWRNNRTLLAGVVLWLGWVALFGGVFSYTKGIYHSYYTSALAPGIAALVGISVVALADLVRKHRAWLMAAAGVAAATVWAQLVVSGRFTGFYDYLRPYTVAIVIVGLALSAIAALWRRAPVVPGLAIVVAGLLLLPGAWTSYETAHASLNTTLPQAGPRQGAAGGTFGSRPFDNGTTQLAAWLQAHRDPNTRWDLVVQSAQNASTLIAQDQLSVMALGGFLGTDPTITAKQFADLVAAGEVRYVLAGGGFGGRGGFGGPPFRGPNGGTTNPFVNPSNRGPAGGLVPAPNGRAQAPGFGFPGFGSVAQQAAGAGPVLAAVQSACRVVTDPSLPTQFQGSLYDCADQAGALAGR